MKNKKAHIVLIVLLVLTIPINVWVYTSSKLLADELSQTQGEIEALENAYAVKADEISELDSALAAIQSDLAALESELSQQTEAISTDRELLTDKDATVTALAGGISDKEKHLADRQAQMEDMEGQIAELETTLARLSRPKTNTSNASAAANTSGGTSAGSGGTATRGGGSMASRITDEIKRELYALAYQSLSIYHPDNSYDWYGYLYDKIGYDEDYDYDDEVYTLTWDIWMSAQQAALNDIVIIETYELTNPSSGEINVIGRTGVYNSDGSEIVLINNVKGGRSPDGRVWGFGIR